MSALTFIKIPGLLGDFYLRVDQIAGFGVTESDGLSTAIRLVGGGMEGTTLTVEELTALLRTAPAVETFWR